MSARVLCVDDNVTLLDNLQELLADAGYQVRTAASAQAAVVIAAEGYDVALVDLRLPDRDGSELAAELKQRHPDSAVVMLTGFGTVETAAAAVRAGAFAYLMKPVAPPELLLTLEQALRDVKLQSEKRELADRARVAEKLAAVGTMTAGLSHEIRNPLNAASLQLAVMERRVSKLPEELRPALMEPLGLVRDEIRRLDHILQDFLQLARPREIKGARVDLVALANRVLDFIETDAERRGVKMVRKLGPAVFVNGSEDQLRQVLMNLVLNALDATPKEGKVTVATSTAGVEAELSVEDTGPGIPPEVRDRIFEPFFTTKAQGSGLGLPIVHGIITQHSGTIRYEAGSSGGARFVIRFPLAR
ncbi:MAG: response regulator [Myxococcaceae bacterium]